MTKKTRYFLIGSVGVLVLGLAGGLVAYLAYTRGAGVPPGVPPEVRYVPATAEVVAFANVQEVMNSELRRELVPTLDSGSSKGQRMMNDFGIDLEKQVNRVVAYLEPSSAPPAQEQGPPQMPNAVVLIQGTFDQAQVEKLISDRAGAMDDYNGRKIFVHREDGHQFAVGLAGEDVIAIGQADLVRRAMDRAASDGQNITANAEMMNLIRDTAGSTAWVVGEFDAVRRRMRLPNDIAGQVPPLRMLSVKANVNGGVKATIRAEAGDAAAADQLRDVVRGFISLARLQASGKPDFENTLKTVELSGTDKTVQMSFAVAPDTIRMIAPRRRQPEAGK